MKTLTNFTLKKNLLTFSLDLDPDPHSSQKLDLDPHIMYADSKHWGKYYLENKEIYGKFPRKYTHIRKFSMHRRSFADPDDF
jgi:hypothetical protein